MPSTDPPSTFHDVRPPELQVTIGEGGRRKWIYADLPQGRFARARNVVYSVLIVFYLIAPFLSIGSQPFLRFDLPARHFSIVGVTFVATDLYLLALLLLLATLGLFLFSAVLGRLWCGWACPQTVYLEGVFRRLERWIEGTPLRRRVLDSFPRDDTFWTKKIFKHVIFLVISVVLALGFVAYFIGPWNAMAMLADRGATHPAAMITAVILTGLTYWNFSSFREQLCTFLCPYARFQSVMLDEHSLIIGYDPVRGEPRGPLRAGHSFEGRGDCVDCKRCVQVCPTGIDIRHGLQLECVNCTACIDACDAVMERVSRPRGLIRYDSLAGLVRKPKRLVRARVVLYSVVTLLLLIVMTTRLIGREAVSLSVTRPAGVPYLVQEDGLVRNTFMLHITNSEPHAMTVTVEADGPDGLKLLVPGQPYVVESGGHARAEAFVMLPAGRMISPETPVTFRLMESGSVRSSAHAIFLGPVHR